MVGIGGLRRAVVWGALSAALLVSSPVLADWQSLGPGVDLEYRVLPGPNHAWVLRINLCTPGVHMRATAPDERASTTSAWGAKTGVLAAINGGFFSPGNPRVIDGPAVGNRTVWTDSAPTASRRSIAFGANLAQFASLQGGDAIPSTWEEAVSGDAMLVIDGVAQHGIGGVCPNRNPLTAAGLSQDGTMLYLITVDGRKAGGSVGMTCNEMADLLVSYGSYQALRLDGGGSTTMWVNGRGRVSVPSDGSERVVGNHLGVYAYGSGAPRSCVTRDVPNFLSGVKRHIPTTTSFANWKYSLLDVFSMDDGVIAMFNDGKAMPEAAPSLWKNEAGNALYLIEGTVKRPIMDLYGIAAWNFHMQTIETHTDAELDALLTGSTLPQTPVVVKGAGDGIYLLDHPLPYRMQVTESVWPASVPLGQDAEVKLKIQNIGGLTWKPGEVSLRPSAPRGEDSPLCDKGTWESCSRITTVQSEVPFAGFADVTFKIHGNAVGTTRFCVNMVGQKEIWFSDTDQGGPADDKFCADIRVGKGRPNAGGCAVGTASDIGGAGCWALFGLAALLWRRRRSRGHQWRGPASA